MTEVPCDEEMPPLSINQVRNYICFENKCKVTNIDVL